MKIPPKLPLLAVAGLLLTGFPSAFAQNWTLTSAPITNWSSVAMSAVGSHLVATVASGLIYLSTNGGTTWTESDAPPRLWSTVATSADGNKWIAAGYGAAYVSTNAGANWTFNAITPTNNYWAAVGSSADGRILVAADLGTGAHFPSLLFVSTNAGATWTVSVESVVNRITAVATSADGIYWLATGEIFDMSILASSDRAHIWIETPSPKLAWTGTAVSADGRVAVAAAGYSGIYVTPNRGTNWIATSVPYASWRDVASSADGSKLAAVANSGLIYISTNSGVGWVSANAPITNWSSVASSADGSKLVAVVNGGGIYTWQATPSPKLNITHSGNGLLISWIAPSMPLVLQETAGLNTTDWIDVPTQPALNLTNLHNEVVLPLSSSYRFYRLKSL